jgi:putative endonuclease
MASRNEFGARGEKMAKEYLEKQGYEILDENWIFNKAEIDLIAYRDSTIVFAEVKTRSTNSFGEPEDFVDPGKQKLLVSAADEYIYLMDHKHEVRFDIISILFDKFDRPVIRHIEDAFWPSDG